MAVVDVSMVVHLSRVYGLPLSRAEAGKLLAMAVAEIDRYPTAALAYARASLELADTREARLLAIRALAKGPPATVLEPPLPHIYITEDSLKGESANAA